MFSPATDASKVALVHLVALLADEYADRRVLDTQWQTRTWQRSGVVEIPREPEYSRPAACRRRWTLAAAGAFALAGHRPVPNAQNDRRVSDVADHRAAGGLPTRACRRPG